MLNTDQQLICKEVRVENTNFCNGACVICPREEMTRPLATMTMGKFCDLVEQSYRLGAESIGIFGFGEPLLDKSIVEKVSYAARRGLETHITTNASMLTTDLSFSLLSAGLAHIRFSVHATSPITYKKVHKNLDYFSTIYNIVGFIQANKDLGKPCVVHLISIPQNGETVDSIRNVFEPLVDYLEIWTAHNWGGAKHYRAGKKTKKSCFRPMNGPLQIQADGLVIPCCFLTNAEIVLGNTWDKSIVEILQDEPYRKLQEAHRTGNLKGYPCEHCDQLFDNGAESPLLYSNRDPDKNLNTLSTSKIKIKED